MYPGIDPKVDYAFKKVFGSESNRDVLVDLINAVLQFGPGREVVEVEILNPFNDKEFANDKLSVVDVKARDATGRTFAVEMQMLARADHRQRLLYYATRLYFQQLADGEDYKKLQPAFLISFVNSRVIADSTAFHTRFVLRDAVHNLTFTDDFAVHMIELTKVLAVVGESPDALNNWCNFLMNANQTDADAVKSPAIRKAMATLRGISENERERELYESRWKRQHDDLSVAVEYAEKDAEYARGQADLARSQADLARVQADLARAQAELRNGRLAEVDRYRALAEQSQLLADRVDDPEIKAKLLRQHDQHLGEAEALSKVLREVP